MTGFVDGGDNLTVSMKNSLFPRQCEYAKTVGDD